MPTAFAPFAGGWEGSTTRIATVRLAARWAERLTRDSLPGTTCWLVRVHLLQGKTHALRAACTAERLGPECGQLFSVIPLTLRSHLYTIQAYQTVLWQLTRSTLVQEKLPQANGPSARWTRLTPRAYSLHSLLAPRCSQLTTSHPPNRGIMSPKMHFATKCAPTEFPTTYVAKNVLPRQNSPRHNSPARDVALISRRALALGREPVRGPRAQRPNASAFRLIPQLAPQCSRPTPAH
jgi:hypothetical protein